MISEHVVNLATEWLDQCITAGKTATLVEMHWYIDARNKTLPSLCEVNEALARRPKVFVTRENASVVFSINGSDRIVTDHDMKQADSRYREEFAAALGKLHK